MMKTIMLRLLDPGQRLMFECNDYRLEGALISQHSSGFRQRQLRRQLVEIRLMLCHAWRRGTVATGRRHHRGGAGPGRAGRFG